MSHQFLPAWPSSHIRPESITTSEIHEELPEVLTMDELQQGELYIVKSKLVVIALFQGWNDEMCCFSILRTDMIDELKWYEARYLPMNFDAFPAFDYAGNPSIFLFPKQLRAIIPINWFNIFEEARHAQRVWKDATRTPKKPFYFLEHAETGDNEQELVESPVEIKENAGDDDDLSPDNSIIKQEIEEEHPQITQDKTMEEQSITQTKQEDSPSPVAQKELIPENPIKDSQKRAVSPLPTPLQSATVLATSLKDAANEIPARKTQNQVSMPSLLPRPIPVSPTNASNKVIDDTPAKTFQRQVSQQMDIKVKESVIKNRSLNTNEPSKQMNQSKQENRPEMNKRRSLSSFFRKKSKKVDKKETKEHKKEEKRKSAPPSTRTTSVKSVIPKQEEPPLPKQEEKKEIKLEDKSNILKKKSMDKLEIFDYETFFDMQATFAFLNSNDPFENTLTSIPVVNK